MNWFLFIATEPFVFEDTIMQPGQTAVGNWDRQPGIKEMKHGILYVVPENCITQYHRTRGLKKISSALVREAILDYYGIN